MLIATFLALMMIFGGGGSEYVVLPDNYMDVLKVEMPDEEQRKSVEQIAEKIPKEMSAYLERQEELMDEGRKLGRDYVVDQAGLDQVLKEMVDNRLKCQAKILDRRFELVGMMNKEQWEALWKPRPGNDG